MWVEVKSDRKEYEKETNISIRESIVDLYYNRNSLREIGNIEHISYNTYRMVNKYGNSISARANNKIGSLLWW